MPKPKAEAVNTANGGLDNSRCHAFVKPRARKRNSTLLLSLQPESCY